MKRSLVVLLPLILAACSSSPKVETLAPAHVEQYATQQYGAVIVTIDSKGNWVQLVSIASSALADDTPKQVKVAFMRAEAEAKANIAKFMTTRLSHTNKQSISTEDDIVLHNGKSTTTERASELLKGITFDGYETRGDHVSVRATLSPKSISVANQVRASMLQAR